MAAQEDGERVSGCLKGFQTLVVLFVLQMEVGSDCVEGWVLISGLDLTPLLARLFELVGPNEGHNSIHLHQLSLLSGQLRVCANLLLNPVTELFPVEIANHLLDLNLV